MLKSKVRKFPILISICCLALHVVGCGSGAGGSHHGGGSGGGGSTPSIPWSTKQLGTTADDIGYGVALDSSGNIYVTGSTGGSLDGVTIPGLNDLFLVKYNSSGTQQWIRQRGTVAQDVCFAIGLDSGSNIYLAGSTGGGLDGNANAGLNDLFLVKYDSAGNWEWSRQLGTIADDIAYALDLDTTSNIYLTGSTGGGLDGNTNAGGLDIFVVKYDSSGNLQ